MSQIKFQPRAGKKFTIYQDNKNKLLIELAPFYLLSMIRRPHQIKLLILCTTSSQQCIMMNGTLHQKKMSDHQNWKILNNQSLWLLWDDGKRLGLAFKFIQYVLPKQVVKDIIIQTRQERREIRVGVKTVPFLQNFLKSHHEDQT